MNLKQSLGVNVVLGMAFAGACVVILLHEESDNTVLKLDLKNAQVEIAVKRDEVDTEQLLQALLLEQKSATLGILNGLGFYAKDDPALIGRLEAEVDDNPVVAKLREQASGFTGIFSNRLLPVILKIANQFSPTPLELAACRESQYYDRQILLSSADETRFFIGHVANAAACSTTSVDLLYVSAQLGQYLLGCESGSQFQLDAKVQFYDDDPELPDTSDNHLCVEKLQVASHRE